MIFKLFPGNEPNFKGINYLVIIKYLGTHSYAFRYFNDNCEFEVESRNESVCAFCEVAPIEIMWKLNESNQKTEA